eukprot:TRINITY_DN1177_c0_g1_i1.p1 TRINITY_DN1177_c0_g1~~TRINITY_DN1177_c0_g1_i1.p1  ORF type:complete len:691 (+),score=241.81 TRINITY_DN1177_c0_g1_i1:78-2150(+)
MGCTHSLEEGQQIVVRDLSNRTTVINGPGRKAVPPASTVVCKRQAVLLKDKEHAQVVDSLTGKRRVVMGPSMLMLGATEDVVKVEALPTLERGMYCVIKDESKGLVRTVYGPNAVTLDAYEVIVGNVRTCPVLAQGQCCKVTDHQTGEERVVCGPQILNLGPHEVAGSITNLPILQHSEYCKICNKRTGEVRIVIGPTVPELGPHDVVQGGTRKLPMLERGEFCKIHDTSNGSMRIVFGPSVVELGPYEEPAREGVTRCPDLSGEEYLVVRDESVGSLRNVVGPVLFMPGPFDVFGRPKKVINLQKNEYVKLRDSEGTIRVERGEARVIPDPLDVVYLKREAINIDAHNAVLIRNTDTGVLELVTEHGLFFPSALQEVVEVQQKIVLDKYQTVVCRDKQGTFYYAKGDTDLPDSERGPGPDFFLPPYHSFVKQSWSTDLRKEHKTSELVWRFDSRPSYMNYKFECRTLDNVTLIVDVTFFWAIIDVRAMLENTTDAPGDACTHARSMIIQKISQMKLMSFLSNFNEIIKSACLDDAFYLQRGIDMKSVEVLKFECENKETNEILQDIIKETCDRMRFKERQKGENEVALEKLMGEIEEERKRQQLIEVKKSHLKVEAKIEGEAKGARIGEFLSYLATSNIDNRCLGIDQALALYDLRERYANQLEVNAAVADGNSQLYMQPADINLDLKG